MEKYPKLFVRASIIYLLAGVLFGLFIALYPQIGINPVFVHVHLNLFGFMAFIIFGIGYHILPRFNAKPVQHPKLIVLHFYLQNIGLIGLVVSYLAAGSGGFVEWNMLFRGFALLSTLSVLIFIFNIYPVLTNVYPAVDISTTASSAPIVPKSIDISPRQKLGMIIENRPEVLNFFIESGFKTLENPAARASFAKMITLSQACDADKIDAIFFITKLKKFLISKGFNVTVTEEQKNEKSSSSSMQKEEILPHLDTKESEVLITPTLKRGEKCTGSVFIGDLISVYPQTKKVIEKYYGGACFSCPGQANETIEQSALMHGTSLDLVLSDINQEIDTLLMR